jgi:hypothetical protein
MIDLIEFDSDDDRMLESRLGEVRTTLNDSLEKPPVASGASTDSQQGTKKPATFLLTTNPCKRSKVKHESDPGSRNARLENQAVASRAPPEDSHDGNKKPAAMLLPVNRPQRNNVKLENDSDSRKPSPKKRTSAESPSMDDDTVIQVINQEAPVMVPFARMPQTVPTTMMLWPSERQIKFVSLICASIAPSDLLMRRGKIGSASIEQKL